MKTRSGKTYFGQGEERCPVCLDSSWQAVGGTRLLCVEGCGCPVPSTHAHCYLNMTAACDVAGDGRRMTRCPGCTREVTEPMPSVFRKAQHNHEVLRRADPAYSTERTAVMHALARGAAGMIEAARHYHARTRRLALGLADAQGELLARAHDIVRCVDSGQSAGAVRAAAVAAREAAIRVLRESSEARVLVHAGLQDPVDGVRHGNGGGRQDLQPARRAHARARHDDGARHH